MKIHLVADVLDMQLVDQLDIKSGRIDGVILELRDGQPPRVAFVEVSPITLLGRFSERLARWYARIDARFGASRGVPFRITWDRLTLMGPTVKLNDAIERTPIDAVEDWLRVHIIGRIPGS